MPVVLVVLFVIALLIMLAGLLLTPRSQPRSSQGTYITAAQKRRLAEPGSRSTATTVRVRAGRVSGRTGVMDTDLVDLPIGARRASRRTANVAQPLPAPPDRLIDRAGSWKVVIPGLVMIFLLGLFLFNAQVPGQLLWMTTLFKQPSVAMPTPTAAPTTYTASKDLVRLSQLDPAQYQSTDEFNEWAYSACSAASMTEVINAYGHNYRITDILKVEAGIHEITADEGLLEESGIENTGKHFNFKTTWGHNMSLDQVIDAANSGTPVIVSFPPQKYPGGHLLVVRGGDQNNVLLADSSLYNRTTVTRDYFLNYWGGFSAIMTPN